MREKKHIQKGLLISLIVISMLNVSACASIGKNNLEIKTNTLGSVDERHFEETSYLKYSELFDESQKPTGRYSNATSDGKVRWNIDKTTEYKDNIIH